MSALEEGQKWAPPAPWAALPRGRLKLLILQAGVDLAATMVMRKTHDLTDKRPWTAQDVPPTMVTNPAPHERLNMTNANTMHTSPHALPSYLNAQDLGPWGIYLQQVDRVTPYLGSLSRWVETL